MDGENLAPKLGYLGMTTGRPINRTTTLCTVVDGMYTLADDVCSSSFFKCDGTTLSASFVLNLILLFLSLGHSILLRCNILSSNNMRGNVPQLSSDGPLIFVEASSVLIIIFMTN